MVIPIGYAFFPKSKYTNQKLQRLLTIKRKTILYSHPKWKISTPRTTRLIKHAQQLVYHLPTYGLGPGCVTLAGYFINRL